MAWKLGEIAEGLQAPELEDVEMWEGERGGEGGVPEFEQERIVLTGHKRGEVSEIGGGAETGLERECEIAGGLTGVGEPVIDGIEQKGREVEEVGVGRGQFKIRDERIDESEGFLLGGLFGGGIGIEKEEVGATGDGPDGAKAWVNAKLSGGVVDRDEVGFFALSRR